MAYLRKKPTPEAVVDTATPVEPSIKPAPTDGSEVAAEYLREQMGAMQRETEQEPPALSADERRHQWIQATPIAQRHADKLNDLHRAALESGLADTSPQYFDYMTDRLAALAAQPPIGQHIVDDMERRIASRPEPEPRPNVAAAQHLSAPVSRGPVGYSGRPSGPVTLSPAHREAAKIAGVSEAEYGKQLQIMNDLKAAGEYGDGR
jgi:hypothetical protein